jgi:Protein of unknown function (DUF3177)
MLTSQRVNLLANFPAPKRQEPMPDALYRSLVWLDYRLAVVFTVIVPLILLVWAFASKADAIQRLLIIYWRVSSLLAITAYMMIASLPISFVSGAIACLLIPISLWFWADLNEEIEDQQSSLLRWATTAWRWAVTVYCPLSALFQLPALRCAGLPTQSLIDTPICRVWLEAPWGYKAWFHPNASPQFLGFVGIVGLIVYTLYFAYFVVIRLSRQGRSAT